MSGSGEKGGSGGRSCISVISKTLRQHSICVFYNVDRQKKKSDGLKIPLAVTSFMSLEPLNEKGAS